MEFVGATYELIILCFAYGSPNHSAQRARGAWAVARPDLHGLHVLHVEDDQTLLFFKISDHLGRNPATVKIPRSHIRVFRPKRCKKGTTDRSPPASFQCMRSILETIFHSPFLQAFP